jgi:hypothetical protein
MEIGERIYNGNRAKEILDNEVFQAVIADMKQEFIKEWENSPARDTEGRERLWNLLKLTEKFEAMIRKTFDTGRLATEELKHQETLATRAKDWMQDHFLG